MTDNPIFAGPRHRIRRWRNYGMGMGFGVGIEFLFRDDFITAEAAPLTSPRTAEPGPGIGTIVDTGNNYNIASNLLTNIAQAGANNPQIETIDSFVRNIGMGFFTRISTGHVNDRNQLGLWDVGNVRRIFFDYRGGVNNISIWTNNIQIPNIAPYPGIDVFTLLTGVARSMGAFFLVNNVLVWVGDTGAATPLMAKSGSIDSTTSQNIDYIRIHQLPSPWDTDYGVATSRLAGARGAGDTFVHEADCLIEFVVDALPGAGFIQVWFRRVDQNNSWYVFTDSTGVLSLVERVAGVPTVRGTAAGVVAGGDRIMIIAEDETIRVYEANNLRITYALAANFKTITAGELETEGIGGSVSDIVTWPRVLSGAALRALDRVANA